MAILRKLSGTTCGASGKILSKVYQQDFVTASLVLALVVGVTADYSSTCSSHCGVVKAVCDNNLAANCFSIFCSCLQKFCEESCLNTVCPCVSKLYQTCNEAKKSCSSATLNSRFCLEQYKSCIKASYGHCYSSLTDDLTTGFVASTTLNRQQNLFTTGFSISSSLNQLKNLLTSGLGISVSSN